MRGVSLKLIPLFLFQPELSCFMGYPWPGNVRELKGALEFAFLIAEDGLIDLDQLPPQIAEPARMSRQHATDQVEFGVTWKDQLPPADSPEKMALVEAKRSFGHSNNLTL